MEKIPFFNYSIKNESADELTLYIDGSIVDADSEQVMRDWFGIDTATSFKSFREQIDNSNAKTVNVVINSGGGQVVEAFAIHDYIKDLQAKGVKVNTKGIGLVASASTYILMAGDSSISENSFFMIHQVSGWAVGTVDEMEKQFNLLKKFNNAVRDYYVQATEMAVEDIEQMMSNETWMQGKEAVELGFVKTLSNEAKEEKELQPIPTNDWLFSKKSLMAYNNFLNNKNDKMNIKEITNQVKDAIVNHLEELGVIAPKNKAESVEKFNEIFKPMNETMEDLRADIDALRTDVDALCTDVDKLLETETEQEEKAVEEEATENKNEVSELKNEIEALKKTIANRAGNATQSNQNIDAGKFAHAGVKWGEN